MTIQEVLDDLALAGFGEPEVGNRRYTWKDREEYLRLLFFCAGVIYGKGDDAEVS